MEAACKCAIARDNTLFLVKKNDVIQAHALGSKKPCWNWGCRHIEADPGPGEFTSVSGLAVSDRYVYVCDFLNQRVHIFRHDGSWVNMVSGTFQYPAQVGVLAKRRQIIIRDQGTEALQCFSLLGVWERNIEPVLLARHVRCVCR